MAILRKIVFYTFLAIYLTICPLLILRMLGFIINPQTRQLVKTGIIYVSSNPPGADVYINNLKANEATPTVIRDLPPDNYTVRLQLKDYQTWENTVPVAGRKATALENILLTPQQWTVRPLSSISFENLKPIADGNVLLAWRSKSVNDLYLLRLNKISLDNSPSNADTSSVTHVFPEESIYNNAQVLKFFIVEKSPFFVLHTKTDDKEKYLWVDIKDKQTHIEDISELLPIAPQRLWWEANDDKNIYAFYADRISRLDIKTKAIYTNIPLKDIPKQKKPSLSRANMKGSVFNEEDGQWLGFMNKKIGLWDKEGPGTKWLFEKGRNIQRVFWANNGSAVIFQDNNHVSLLDKEQFTQARLQKIASIKDGSASFYSEKTGQLYYIEPNNRLLCTVNILHHKTTLPKTIADTLRLKEFEP